MKKCCQTDNKPISKARSIYNGIIMLVVIVLLVGVIVSAIFKAL